MYLYFLIDQLSVQSFELLVCRKMTSFRWVLERDSSLNRKGDLAFTICVSEKGSSVMDESSKENKACVRGQKRNSKLKWF